MGSQQQPSVPRKTAPSQHSTAVFQPDRQTLRLELEVQDPLVIEELLRFAEGEPRQAFALHALRIGVLAIKQAQGQIDQQRLREVAEELLGGLQHAFEQHRTMLHERIKEALGVYFNEEDGKFNERIGRLLAKDGDLERFLRQKVGSEDSELVKALEQFVGRQSPLFRLLDPQQADGLLAHLRQEVQRQLQEQREAVLRQFSLDDEQSALSRFIRQLHQQHGELTENLEEKIEELVKEFSLDDEQSALSRLVGKVEQAQRKITDEFSLDNQHSALSRLRRELLEQLKEGREEQQKFQLEVTKTLESLQARREEARRGTQHGRSFEEALFTLLEHEAARLGDVAENTGDTTGAIARCKVGDVVVTLGPESAAPEARIVFEAKAERGYHKARALEELRTARENRQAQVGVFVFRRDAAPSAMEPLARHGNDLLVFWDPEDPHTDLYVKAAYGVARALCVRRQQVQSECQRELDALEEAVGELQDLLSHLDQIKTWTQTIQNNAEKIQKRAARMAAELEKQLGVLQTSAKALRTHWERATSGQSPA